MVKGRVAKGEAGESGHTQKTVLGYICIYKAFLYSMYSLILALSDNYSFGGGGGDGPNSNNPTTVLVMLLFGVGVIVGL